jgi:hypothetical protein
LADCCNCFTVVPSFPPLCPATVALRRPDGFIHIRCPAFEFEYRRVLRRRRVINPQMALTEPSPSSHRCCISLHVEISGVPKSEFKRRNEVSCFSWCDNWALCWKVRCSSSGWDKRIFLISKTIRVAVGHTQHSYNG